MDDIRLPLDWNEERRNLVFALTGLSRNLRQGRAASCGIPQAKISQAAVGRQWEG
jgi:hypothetical protein